MKYVLIVVIAIAGSYYFKQNLNDCETEYDVQKKSLEFMDKVNEIARASGASSRMTYRDVRETLERIKERQSGELKPKLTCAALDLYIESMEKELKSGTNFRP